MFLRSLLFALTLLSTVLVGVANATPGPTTPPAIKFTAPTDPATYGGSFTVVLTAAAPTSSIVISIDSTTTSICSLSNGVVSYIGVGDCKVNATFPGDATYQAGSKTLTITVAPAPSNFQFSQAPNNAVVGGAAYNITATSLSDKTPSFVIDNVASSVCTISGNAISFIGVGTCSVTGSVAASTSGYYKAASKQQTFNVGKGSQTISFTSTAPATPHIGDTYLATATSTAQLPVTLSIASASAGICSLANDGTTVSLLATGTCTINANQAGTADYNAASQQQQGFTVLAVAATHFLVEADATAAAGTSITVTVTALDGDDVKVPSYAGTVEIGSSDAAAALPPNATLTDGVGTFDVTLKTVGTQSISATDADDDSLTGSGSVVVSPGAPASITATAGTPQDANATTGSFDAFQAVVKDAVGNVIPGASVTFAAPETGASGTFANDQISTSADTDETGVATSSTFTPNGVVGSYTVHATVAALSADFELENTGDAPQVTTPPSAQDVAVGATATFTAAASGNPTPSVQWQVSTDDGEHFNDIQGATSTTLSFSAQIGQTGSQYRAVFTNSVDSATTDAATLTVGKLTQTLSFSSAAPTDAIVGGTPYSPVVPSGGSTADVVLSIDPSASDYCSISAGTVSFTGVGTCVIVANQAGDATHSAAAPKTQSFDITQTVSHFNVSAPLNAVAGAPITNITVTALDSNDEVVTGYAGEVHFTSSDGAATLPADYAFGGGDSGAHTFSVTLVTTGPRTITVTDTLNAGMTGTSSSIIVGQALPAVTALSPAAGPPEGGTSVTITGLNLSHASAVMFGDTAALSFDLVSETTITAVAPAGNGSVDVTVTTPGGTSEPSGGDTFSYSAESQQSRNLDSVESQFTPTVATQSMSVVTDMVTDAVALGFADMSTSSADLDNVFFGYAAPADKPTPFDGILVDQNAKLPPNVSLWMDTTGSGLLPSNDTPQKGWQVNVTGGVGLRVNDSLVVGGLAGFERFAYKNGDLDATLSGSGTSLGGYLGWKITDKLLATFGVVHTDLGYDVASGDAAGSFSGSRWLVSGALSGEFALDAFTVRPSARIAGIWERDGDYIDSLDAAHDSQTFGSATASVGILVSRALPITEEWQLVPHIGAYVDARTGSTVGSDGEPGDATGRVTAGADIRTGTGASLGIDGQVGGIGSDTLSWSAKGSVRAAF